MAINKKLIHFKTKANFDAELAKKNILDTSIVFIQDANKIWTHGTYYASPYTKEELDAKFAAVAEGGIRGIEVYISTTAPTDSNYMLWINPNDNILKYRSGEEWIALNVLTDPNDGKYYVRQNKLWVPLPNEVYKGTTEPTNGEILWINPETGEIKYKKDDGTWDMAEGGGSDIGVVTETVKIKLSSNQTQPDTNLNGATITITYLDVTKTELWNNEVITVLIPMNISYTVSVSNIEGYTKPADVSYTAVMGNSRNIDFIYNTTKVNITKSSNQTETLPSSSASVKIGSGTAKSYNLPTTVLVPTGLNYTVTFSNISGYTTPSVITKTAEGASLSVVGLYKATKLTVARASNQNEKLTATATITYNSTTKTINFTNTVDQETITIPYNTNYTISFSNVTGYKTPSNITGTADAANITKTGTYLSEFATVTVNGLGGTPSGYTITVKQGTTVLGTLTASSKLYKIPFGTEYTVSASSVTGFDIPAIQTFTAGNNTRAITVTYIYNPSVDLSMRDIHGNLQSNRTTANCYVVKTAGTYKFPLVYGNAIKNGTTNSAAYTRKGTSNTAPFYNYKDVRIANPYIETDLEETISDAELSVCDTSGVFSDISVLPGTPCKFIQFTITKVPHTGANGVISAKVGDTIVWSWHIWVWEDDLDPITITNNSGNNYDILPVNLGSKWDEDSKLHIKNWFYQWGRSVPLICPTAYNSNTKTTNVGTKTITEAACSSKLSTVLKTPATFYKSNSSYDYNWLLIQYYNWWDANCTSTGASDNKVVKTVYDPCPPGYSVGNGNTFTGFSTSNVVGSFNNGYKFKANSSDTTGIFFPASGYMGSSNGTLGNVGSYGYVWSSALNDSGYAYDLRFDSGYVNPLHGDIRAIGYSVRPVREL